MQATVSFVRLETLPVEEGFARTGKTTGYAGGQSLKYKYGNRSFWCRGYYVDTTGKSTKRIKEYIQNQLKEDQVSDQIALREFKDPFTGGE